MKLTQPSIEFLDMTKDPLIAIERAGRVCYKSEDRITPDSAEKFVAGLVTRGHHAMIEHAWASYRVVCDRGVTHEIVRHRLFSYGQESTRYCNYKGGVEFIVPCWLAHDLYPLVDKELNGLDLSNETFGVSLEEQVWLAFMKNAEMVYVDLVTGGWTPQEARSVLPNALKTEIVITGNFREWLHFFKLRTSPAAHPQMQEIAKMLWEDMKSRVPIVFDDLSVQGS